MNELSVVCRAMPLVCDDGVFFDAADARAPPRCARFAGGASCCAPRELVMRFPADTPPRAATWSTASKM